MGIVDYNEMASAQNSDWELRSLLESDTGLELKLLTFHPSNILLYNDVSTGSVRPYVPPYFRRKVLDIMHNISDPGIESNNELDS